MDHSTASASAPALVDIRDAISRAAARGDFTREEMAALFGHMMDRRVAPTQIAALLVALHMKGETVEEVVGAARAMRERGTRLRVPEGPLIDTCGTGGDGAGTLNISTLAALVVAACGVRVAKHGNRAQSSRAGSADLLQALGVDVDAPIERVERCLAAVGIGFMFAPRFHEATRSVAEVRRALGVRTLFNLLGPLTNPADARHQVVGVFSPAWVEPLCRALGELGAERALVVHGLCVGPAGSPVGLDELSPDGETQVAEWREGEFSRYTLTPADFGLGGEVPAQGPHSLWGGTAEENARRARAILSAAPEEQRGAAWRAVLMTAACALWVAGAEEDLPTAAARAAAALRSGRAQSVLEDLARVSHGRA